MAMRAKYSKRCVRDAILILDICALTPGYPTIGSAYHSVPVSARASVLAGRAWRHASLRHLDETLRVTDAYAAAYLRDGWLPSD